MAAQVTKRKLLQSPQALKRAEAVIVWLAAQWSALFYGVEDIISDSAVNVGEWFPKTQPRPNSLTVDGCPDLFYGHSEAGQSAVSQMAEFR